MTSKKTNTPSMTPFVEAPNISMDQKDYAQKKLKELMQEESKLVKGRFKCYETPDAAVKITVRKYPGPKQGGIPHFEKTMIDGGVYEIPLYVARHLNGIDVSAGAGTNDVKCDPNIGTCSYPIHGFKTEGDRLAEGTISGDTIVPNMTKVARRVQRFGFESLEFSGAR